MVPPRRRETLRNLRTATGLAATVALLSSCGSDSDYANEPRPPTPINITAAITKDRVTVSPRAFGAGPVVLIVANQTAEAHKVTIESDTSSAPGIRQSSAPINPDGTATLKIDIKQGRYKVSVDGQGITDTDVRVGAARKSSSDELLTP